MLIKLEIPARLPPAPPEATEFCEEALLRAHALLDDADRDDLLAAFVPSDAVKIYPTLAWLVESRLPEGRLFCEWGSGLGAVACLAAMVGWRAHGIEIEPTLVGAAQQLAADYDVDVPFACGSFLLAQAAHEADARYDEPQWLSHDGVCGHALLGFDPDDFDCVFAYPWPGERRALERHFQQVARSGALLLTYSSCDTIRLQQKRRK